MSRHRTPAQRRAAVARRSVDPTVHRRRFLLSLYCSLDWARLRGGITFSEKLLRLGRFEARFRYRPAFYRFEGVRSLNGTLMSDVPAAWAVMDQLVDAMRAVDAWVEGGATEDAREWRALNLPRQLRGAVRALERRINYIEKQSRPDPAYIRAAFVSA